MKQIAWENDAPPVAVPTPPSPVTPTVRPSIAAPSPSAAITIPQQDPAPQSSNPPSARVKWDTPPPITWEDGSTLHRDATGKTGVLTTPNQPERYTAWDEGKQDWTPGKTLDDLIKVHGDVNTQNEYERVHGNPQMYFDSNKFLDADPGQKLSQTIRTSTDPAVVDSAKRQLLQGYMKANASYDNYRTINALRNRTYDTPEAQAALEKESGGLELNPIDTALYNAKTRFQRIATHGIMGGNTQGTENATFGNPAAGEEEFLARKGAERNPVSGAVGEIGGSLVAPETLAATAATAGLAPELGGISNTVGNAIWNRGLSATASKLAGNVVSSAVGGAGFNAGNTIASNVANRQITMPAELAEATALGGIAGGLGHGLTSIAEITPVVQKAMAGLPPTVQSMTRVAQGFGANTASLVAANAALKTAKGEPYTMDDLVKDIATSIPMHIAGGGPVHDWNAPAVQPNVARETPPPPVEPTPPAPPPTPRDPITPEALRAKAAELAKSGTDGDRIVSGELTRMARTLEEESKRSGESQSTAPEEFDIDKKFHGSAADRADAAAQAVETNTPPAGPVAGEKKSETPSSQRVTWEHAADNEIAGAQAEPPVTLGAKPAFEKGTAYSGPGVSENDVRKMIDEASQGIPGLKIIWNSERRNQAGVINGQPILYIDPASLASSFGGDPAKARASIEEEFIHVKQGVNGTIPRDAGEASKAWNAVPKHIRNLLVDTHHAFGADGIPQQKLGELDRMRQQVAAGHHITEWFNPEKRWGADRVEAVLKAEHEAQLADQQREAKTPPPGVVVDQPAVTPETKSPDQLGYENGVKGYGELKARRKEELSANGHEISGPIGGKNVAEYSAGVKRGAAEYAQNRITKDKESLKPYEEDARGMVSRDDFESDKDYEDAVLEEQRGLRVHAQEEKDAAREKKEAEDEAFEKWKLADTAKKQTVSAVSDVLGDGATYRGGTSHYFTTDDGMKIRIADHEAPGGAGWNEQTQERHESPDVNFIVTHPDEVPTKGEIRSKLSEARRRLGIEEPESPQPQAQPVSGAPADEPTGKPTETPQAAPAKQEGPFKNSQSVSWGDDGRGIVSRTDDGKSATVQVQPAGGGKSIQVKRSELTPRTAETMGLKTGDMVDSPLANGPFEYRGTNKDGTLQLLGHGDGRMRSADPHEVGPSKAEPVARESAPAESAPPTGKEQGGKAETPTGKPGEGKGAAKEDAFSNTKQVLRDIAAKRKNAKNPIIPSLGGMLSDHLENATKLAVAIVKDLAVQGKHGFDNFVHAVSKQVFDSRLRSFMLKGKRDPDGKMYGGVRDLYNAAREHPDIVSKGIQNTMTPANELPTNIADTLAGARMTPEQIEQRAAERKAVRSLPPKPPTEAQALRNATVENPETTKETIARTAQSGNVRPDVDEKKALASKMKAQESASESGYKAGQQTAAHDLAGTVLGMKWEANNAAQFQQAVRQELAERASELPPEVARSMAQDIANAKSPADYRAAVVKMQKSMGVYGLPETEMNAKIAEAKRNAGKAGAAGEAEINRRLTNTVAPPEQQIDIGKAIRASMTIRAAGEQALESLKGKNEVAQDVKDKIVDAAKDLPLDLKGRFITMVRDANTPNDLKKSLDHVDEATALYELRQNWASAKAVMDNLNMTKLDPENRAQARGAVAQLQKMGPDLFAAERDAVQRRESGENIKALMGQIQEAVASAKQMKAKVGATELQSGTDVSEPPKTPVGKALAQIAKGLPIDIAHIREQHSPVQRDMGKEAYDSVVNLATVNNRATGTVDSFLKSIKGEDAKETKLLQGRVIATMYRNNADALEAQGKNPIGIPRISDAEYAANIKDPRILNAMKKWQSDIEPMLTDIRKKLGLPTEGWENLIPDKARLNLSPVQQAPRGLGLFGADQQMKTVYDQEAFGTGEYITDPRKALEQIVRKHLMMESMANINDTLEKKGLYIDPSKVIDRNGSQVAEVNGKELPVREVTIPDKENGGVQSKFVPSRLLDAYKDVYDQSKPHTDSLVDKLTNASTAIRLAGGIDVGNHFRRILSLTGNSEAQAARTLATQIPYFGKRIAAVKSGIEMAHTPEGEGLQRLVERVGADKGQGYYAAMHENDPHSIPANIMNFGHNLIAGKNLGFDTLARRVVARNLLYSIFGNPEMDRMGRMVNSKQMSPTEYDRMISDKLGAEGRLRLMREVNNTIGYSNRILRAEWINRMQLADPFIGFQAGAIPTELRQYAGLNISPTKINDAVKRGDFKQAALMLSGSIMAGVIGTYAAKNALNYAFTGHFTGDNDKGHENDLALGRGMYVSNFDPAQDRPRRELGMKSGLPNWKDAAIGMGNEGLSIATSNNLTRMAFEALSGHEPYVTHTDDKGAGLMQRNPYWWVPFGAGSVMAEESAKNTPFWQSLTKQAGTFGGYNVKFESPEAKKLSDEEKAEPTLEYARSKLAGSSKSASEEDRHKWKTRDDLVDQLKSGAMKPADLPKTLAPAEAKEIANRAKLTPLQYTIKHEGMNVKDAADVYSKATPTEQKGLRDVVRDKILSARLDADTKKNADAQDKLMANHGISNPPELPIIRLHAEYAKMEEARQEWEKQDKAHNRDPINPAPAGDKPDAPPSVYGAIKNQLAKIKALRSDSEEHGVAPGDIDAAVRKSNPLNIKDAADRLAEIRAKQGA